MHILPYCELYDSKNISTPSFGIYGTPRANWKTPHEKFDEHLSLIESSYDVLHLVQASIQDP